MYSETLLGSEEAGIFTLSRPPSPFTDAGLKGLDHYERRLPRWRHKLRQRLIPIVRWETEYLAWMQSKCRSPMLDTYFAITANLGTHTFFLTALPILYWCGYPNTGTALVQMLALGVYLTGCVKDLLCLPRPLSPPLQRITMSGSAALEYGFPSTHSANAVSVAVFCLYHLQAAQESFAPTTYTILQAGCYCYATSIILGRLYCGMHGFFDVTVGAVVGALIAVVRYEFGTAFDTWVMSGPFLYPAIVILMMGLAVRFHPEPADNCPCFDDSVAFNGVVMGVELGTWHYAGMAGIYSDLGTYTSTDWIKAVGRILLGIFIVFTWKAMMKPLLLRYLPPIYRFVEHWGISIPRRYFKQARDYKRVPPLRKDDNVLPSATDLSAFFSNIRHPRKRAVSIGPQSEADAREIIAYREKKRRDSRSESNLQLKLPRPAISSLSTGKTPPSPLSNTPAVASTQPGYSEPECYLIARTSTQQTLDADLPIYKIKIDKLLTPPSSDGERPSDHGKDDERQDREMFMSLERPRIRYDVEVITRLVVYAGIAWLAVEGNPILFQACGLA